MSQSDDLREELARIRTRLDYLADLRREAEPSTTDREEWARLANREMELLDELRDDAAAQQVGGD